MEFSPCLNILYGDNAQGKTTILEAISLTTIGRSFKTHNLSDLIREGEKFFFLEAEIHKDGLKHLVKIYYDGKEKKAQLDSNSYSSFTPILGSFPSIISAPEDIQIIHDGPQARRKFLDLHIAQNNPLYLHYFARYMRAMKQRNCLLKEKNAISMDMFEMEMANSASNIWKMRQESIEDLLPFLLTHGKRISKDLDQITMKYLPSYPEEKDEYMFLLRKNRSKEMELKTTLAGPHRDDIQFFINDAFAQKFASKGQIKTLISALKLSQLEHIQKKHEICPIFGLDDFEETLDSERKALLTQNLQTLNQVFITTPRPIENVPSAKELQFHLISQGQAFSP